MTTNCSTSIIRTGGRLWRSCQLYLALMSLGWLSSPAYATTPVLMIATSELPPYISADPQRSFLTDLLPEIGKEMGVTFELRFMPWLRCEKAVKSLEAWATMPYVPTPEREEDFLFSQPLYAKRTVLFHYNDPENSAEEPRLPSSFQDLAELSPYKIGGVRGYYYEAIFFKAGITLDLASSEELSFRKLQAGRVDLAPAVEAVGWDIIREHFPLHEHPRFQVMDTPLQVGHNYLMTSRDYPNAEILLEQFNQALQELHRKGVYRNIAIQHGISTAEN